DYFCINISDEGIGIPEEYLDKIFDPFFTTNISQKKGLGLTNAYSIIKKHNGMVKVDSIVGKGTTVKIMLPIAKLN
ncbi:MAG TPA: ATP-binding protein, partial [Bacteroidota bacterium]|nr:ATP-binding protein [Bacteroidota bacterium]